MSPSARKHGLQAENRRPQLHFRRQPQTLPLDNRFMLDDHRFSLVLQRNKTGLRISYHRKKPTLFCFEMSTERRLVDLEDTNYTITSQRICAKQDNT